MVMAAQLQPPQQAPPRHPHRSGPGSSGRIWRPTSSLRRAEPVLSAPACMLFMAGMWQC